MKKFKPKAGQVNFFQCAVGVGFELCFKNKVKTGFKPVFTGK